MGPGAFLVKFMWRPYLEEGDILVVTKLDRLGRDAIDVRMTIKSLARVGVRVHCLALGNVDLTSPTGKMTMGVLSAVAEFERDLLVERTRAGLERAKGEGKKLSRRPCLSPKQCVAVPEALNEDQLPYQVAKDFQVSRQTIMMCVKKWKA